MGLEGTLRVFSLTDIFQMLGLQRKTGVLSVEGEDDTITISFLGGQVVAAESTARRLDNRLGNLLIRAGYVSQEQLDRILEVQRETQPADGLPPDAGGPDRPAGAARSPPPPDRADRLRGVSLARRPLSIQPGGHGRLRRGPHGARVDRLDSHGSGPDGRRVADLREEGRLACDGLPAGAGRREPAARLGREESSRGDALGVARRRPRPGAGSTAGSPSATSWSGPSSPTSKCSRAPPICWAGT